MTHEGIRRPATGRAGRGIAWLLAGALVVLLASSRPVLGAAPDGPEPAEGGDARRAGAAVGNAPDARDESAAPPAGAVRADQPLAKGADDPARSPIVYVPPNRGRARHTAGAGTRGPTQNPPRVAVLAPRDHVGRTSSAHPRLYWHLSEPTATRIELTLVDDEAIEPLLELALPGPVGAGLHALDLGALGIALEPGKTYRWFVAVVHDPLRRSRDELAEGAIERVAAPAAEASGGGGAPARAAGPSRRRAVAFERAQAGFWYDALAAIEDALAEAPSDAGLRADRAALLAQGQLELELETP